MIFIICEHFLSYISLQVHGIIRRSSSFNLGRIHHLFDDPKTHKHDRTLIIITVFKKLFYFFLRKRAMN